MPVGDLPGWHQIMAQNFDTPVALGSFPGPYRSSLYAYNGFADTSGHGLYNPASVLSVHDGMLDWYLHTADGRPQVSSVIPMVPSTGWGQQYGAYSIRFRADQMPGYKVAFMLWPDSNNWSQGEVDFPEVGSLDQGAGNLIYANLYPANRPVLDTGSVGFRTNTLPATGAWHIATIEWVPGHLTFILDGVTVGSLSCGVPTVSMHWVLQAETSLCGAPAASVSGHLQVDWLAMYSRD